MADTDLHVNGPAVIEIATGGSLNFARLGVTVDGPDVELEASFEDVFGDDAGPFLPTDVQYFGELGTIRTEFIRWDEPTLRNVLGRIIPNTAGVNRSPDIGTLVRHPTELGLAFDPVGVPNHFALQYTSAARTGLPREQFRRFPCVYPTSVASFKPGTRVTRFTITWRAIPLDGFLYTFN